MLGISPQAVKELKEKLVKGCSEAGIGFRVVVAEDERRDKTFTIKVDKAREGDKILEADGVRLFLDLADAAQTADYELDYADEPRGGFVLR